MTRTPGEGERPVPGLRTLAGLGSTIALCVLIGLAIGWLVDSRAGTTPLFIFVGLVLGIVAGALGAHRLLRGYLST